MDFAESEEHQALRAAVAEIAKDFGPRYYAEHAGSLLADEPVLEVST